MRDVFKDPQNSDAVIDTFARLQHDLEREHPWLVGSIPTARGIGEQIERTGSRTRHDFPMLELKTINDLGALVRWVDTCQTLGDLVIEPSIEGAHVELIFVGGNLHKAVTKGDGIEGKDVTLNMYSVAGIPMEISETERVNIHGVVTMASVDIMEWDPSGVQGAAQVAATVLNRAFGISPIPLAVKSLQFIPTRVNIPGVTFTLMDLRAILSAWGFMPYESWTIKGITRELGEWEQVLLNYKTEVLNSMMYPSDGVTISVNNTHDRLMLGYTSRWPEWAVKFDKGSIK